MATFASRPAENLDPWYTARETYDQSLEDAIDANETAVGTKADASALTTHTGNTSNPHSVTAAQAGAVPTSATDASGYGFVVDEDDMASDSALLLPTQQSVKAYVDANAAPAFGPALPMESGGKYDSFSHGPYAGSLSTSVGFNGTRLPPILVPNPVTVSALWMYVGTAVGGGLIRLGIYDYDGNLVIDAGTIATDTTGWKSASISQVLDPGWHFLAASASATINVRGCTSLLRGTGIETSGSATAQFGCPTLPGNYTVAGLPASLSFQRYGGNNWLPLVVMEVA